MNFKSQKIIFILLVISFSFVLTSCATIVSGRSQNVVVETDPDGAIVTIDGTIKTSPATFNLSKRKREYTVKFEKVGFQTAEDSIKRGVGGWVWGNILLGGVIGVGVDWMTSSMYKLSPGKISKVLVSAGQPSSATEETIQVRQGGTVSKCEHLAVKSEEWLTCMGLK